MKKILLFAKQCKKIMKQLPQLLHEKFAYKEYFSAKNILSSWNEVYKARYLSSYK